MWILYLGTAIVVLAGIRYIRKAAREYEADQRLSTETVVAVWLLYTLHAALTVAAAAFSVWWLPVSEIVAIVVGAGFIIAGTGLYWAGLLSMRSFKRMSGMRADSLVTSGAFRWSRNPQNVGWGLFLLGIAVLGRSVFALGLVVLFWLTFRAYLAAEERYLEHVFGEQYRLYTATVHRFFGLPKSTVSGEEINA